MYFLFAHYTTLFVHYITLIFILYISSPYNFLFDFSKCILYVFLPFACVLFLFSVFCIHMTCKFSCDFLLSIINLSVCLKLRCF